MRHILANLFISEVFIPEAGLLTVTKVSVTDDLKIARVYLSFLENKKPVEDILEILESKHNIIRRQMGLKLTLKYIPQLQFYYDDSIEHAQRINDLIQKIYKDD
jgi:ribosome-binding factor A